MSRYIDAEALDKAFSKLRFNNDGELNHYGDRPNWYLWGSEIENLIADAPSIDLADYVPKDFHDRTCEAMAKRHQEEIANMVSVVRCKECKKANTEDCSHSYWDDDWGKWRVGYRGDDWFCADGEREGE